MGFGGLALELDAQSSHDGLGVQKVRDLAGEGGYRNVAVAGVPHLDRRAGVDRLVLVFAHAGEEQISHRALLDSVDLDQARNLATLVDVAECGTDPHADDVLGRRLRNELALDLGLLLIQEGAHVLGPGLVGERIVGVESGGPNDENVVLGTDTLDERSGFDRVLGDDQNGLLTLEGNVHAVGALVVLRVEDLGDPLVHDRVEVAGHEALADPRRDSEISDLDQRVGLLETGRQVGARDQLQAEVTLGENQQALTLLVGDTDHVTEHAPGTTGQVDVVDRTHAA